MFLDKYILTGSSSSCRLITHSLVGGGAVQRGFDALDMGLTGQGATGGRKLGTYKRDSQIFYVLSVESILGKLPFFPMVTRAPFRLQCAKTLETLSTPLLTPARDLETAANGGTSTRGP